MQIYNSFVMNDISHGNQNSQWIFKHIKVPVINIKFHIDITYINYPIEYLKMKKLKKF